VHAAVCSKLQVMSLSDNDKLSGDGINLLPGLGPALFLILCSAFCLAACLLLTCVCRKLQVLSLSDNDKLSGELPACWLGHPSLQELQLAGLSDLHGPLPDLTVEGSVTGSEEGRELCGFGKLKYINMAGIIGDAGLGFTGACVFVS
jgi:hypothetical protein